VVRLLTEVLDNYPGLHFVGFGAISHELIRVKYRNTAQESGILRLLQLHGKTQPCVRIPVTCVYVTCHLCTCNTNRGKGNKIPIQIRYSFVITDCLTVDTSGKN